jgi:putative Ca2+/H+ antiporter (TMEM165/GDT1 family)
MDWKVLFTTFGLLFMAELGDKTQLAVVSLASVKESRLSVLLGAIFALSLVTLMGVALGSLLGRWIPKEWMHRGAGILFILFGALLLLQKSPA